MVAMKKFFTSLGFIILSGWLFPLGAYAVVSSGYEDSDPYLSLEVSQKEARPKEEFSYVITFGNRGPLAAENVRITLNLPLGGRAPVQFVSSEPVPSNWLSSEFGSLPEFFVETLESFEATSEGKINVVVVIRDSAIPQTITATASLEASKREIGKRLIISDPVSLEIMKDTATKTEAVTPSETATGEASLSTTQEKYTIPQPLEPPPSGILSSLLASESIWTSLAFLGTALLLLVGFLTGRLSKREKNALQ